MFRSLLELENYGLEAKDGQLGRVIDFYFDDHAWTVRYAVVDTRKWLPGRRVLISPASFGEADASSRTIHVSLTKQQIREAPPVEEDRPVSRQYEVELVGHFAWPAYWGMAPVAMEDGTSRSRTEVVPEEGESNLRSGNEVKGYSASATDGEVGSIADLIVDTDTWRLRYLVVDTRKWLPGGKVLLATEWVEKVRWKDKAVHVGISEEAIRSCPAYDPAQPINRKYEEQLYDYYGRPHYWKR